MITVLRCPRCGNQVTVSTSAPVRGICMCTGQITYLSSENDGVTDCGLYRLRVVEEGMVAGG